MRYDEPPLSEPRPSQERLKTWVLSAGCLIVALWVWHGVVQWYHLPSLVLPTPWAVGSRLVDDLADGSLWPHVWITFIEIILGFCGGSALGIGLGSIVALSPFLQRVLSPYIIASQAMPKLALAPLFVIWFGFGIQPKACISALICFFPLFENTLTGLRDVDRDEVELFRMLGASRWHFFLKLRLPRAVPYMFAGLRVSIVLSVVGAVVGEYVGASQGLGAMIIASQGMMDTTLMFVVFIVLTVMGMILYQLLQLAEWMVLRYRSRIQTHLTPS